MCQEKEIIKHNIDKVKANLQPVAPIVAECNCASAKSQSADQAAGLTNENYHQQEH